MPITTGPLQITCLRCRQHRPNTSNRTTEFDQNLPELCFNCDVTGFVGLISPVSGTNIVTVNKIVQIFYKSSCMS